MDFVAHLPKSSRHHDAIMVLVDKLSKFVRFAPTTTDVSSVDVHRFADKLVSLFGLPKKLITDRDTPFTSNMFTEFRRLFSIPNAFSSAFQPQTDRQAEICNAVLEGMLRHYVGADQTNWDESLPVAEFAVNNSKNDSKGDPCFSHAGPTTSYTRDNSDRLYCSICQTVCRQITTGHQTGRSDR